MNIKINKETKNQMAAFYFVSKIFSTLKSPFGYFCLGIHNGFVSLAHTHKLKIDHFISNDFPGQDSMTCAALSLIESFKIQTKIEQQKELIHIAEVLEKECEEELEEINKIVH